MPWFITAVSKKKDTSNVKNKKGLFIHRCFGFMDNYSEAYKCIVGSGDSLREYLYDYVVLEYIECGIHPVVHVTKWFKWNDKGWGWLPIRENELEKEFVEIMSFTNWALG